MGKKLHSISRFCGYGELNLDTDAPDFIQVRLTKLYDACEPVLDKTLTTAISVRKNNYRDYTPAAAEKKQKEALLKPRLELHKVLRSHLDSVEQGKVRIKNQIRSYSVPKKQKDSAAQLDQTLLLQEIRSLLRAEPDLQQRKKIVAENLLNGNADYIRACTSSPDQLLPGESLLDLQRKLAFMKDRDLQGYEQQVIQQAIAVREKCAEINSSQIIMLESEKLEDPLSKEEHFETFKPESPHDRSAANASILQENRLQKQQDQKDAFNESHPGINM